ncbi:MAG: TadE/TadG family type IV pilus assembly protein [Roseobacter sp.]
MSWFKRRAVSKFWRAEDGNATIEFVIMVPLIFTIFLTAVELGIYSFKQMWLDRGLDIAMREVRLNTQSMPTHDEMKQTVCENAPFITDCFNSLRIEMEPTNPRDFTTLGVQLDCVDRTKPIASQDAPNYLTGQEHDLMLVRACVKFTPIFPTTGLGFALVESGDNAGQAIMSSMSAFVQEPGVTPLVTAPIFPGGGSG